MELADLVARHRLWVDEGRYGETATVLANDIAVLVIDDKTEALAAGFHRYGARRTEDGWRFNHLVVSPVALTETLDRAI